MYNIRNTGLNTVLISVAVRGSGNGSGFVAMECWIKEAVQVILYR
jgi:hypothetical protein